MASEVVFAILLGGGSYFANLIHSQMLVEVDGSVFLRFWNFKQIFVIFPSQEFADSNKNIFLFIMRLKKKTPFLKYHQSSAISLF